MVKQEVRVGTGPVGLLWAAFIILKVAEVIHWSWWIVIFWPLGVLLGIVVAAGLIACIWALWDMCKEADRLQAKKAKA